VLAAVGTSLPRLKVDSVANKAERAVWPLIRAGMVPAGTAVD